MVNADFKRHRHNWQRMERRVKWHLFKLFVCVEHETPVIQAYDLIDTTKGLE